MIRQSMLFAAILGYAILTSTIPATAQGLLDLHAKVRVGNKLCLADHFHSGSSSGRNSRKEAEAAAISSWSGFTAWEYGDAWGHFSLAETKSMSCQNAGGWSCTVDARPCRRGR